ncbi:Nodulin-like, partial [Trema orientale]
FNFIFSYEVFNKKSKHLSLIHQLLNYSLIFLKREFLKLSSGTGANMNRLAVQVLTGRWLMAFATFLLMVASGASYMFSLYSNDIKSVLGYDQTTLNLIGFSKDLGANVGFLSGLISEVTPPWVVLSIGAVLNFVGNFTIWLAIARKIRAPRVPLHSRGSQLSHFHQRRRSLHLRQELPGKPRRRYGPLDRLHRYKWSGDRTIVPRFLRRRHVVFHSVRRLASDCSAVRFHPNNSNHRQPN